MILGNPVMIKLRDPYSRLAGKAVPDGILHWIPENKRSSFPSALSCTNTVNIDFMIKSCKEFIFPYGELLPYSIRTSVFKPGTNSC